MNKIKIHNKLARDLIPDLLKSKNVSHKFRILNDEEYAAALRDKLNEEVAELLDAESDDDFIEEVADVMEVIHSMLAMKRKAFSDVEPVRLAKAADRGGFSGKVYLEYTHTN